jgi:hypothetical protein
VQPTDGLRQAGSRAVHEVARKGTLHGAELQPQGLVGIGMRTRIAHAIALAVVMVITLVAGGAAVRPI